MNTKKWRSLRFLIILVLFCIIIVLGLPFIAIAEADFNCQYKSQYDVDGDYSMNNNADCGEDYSYDCDDSDSTIYTNCKKGLWNWLKSLFKGI